MRSDRGAAAIEYGLLGAVIALGIVAALISTRGKLNDLLSLINVRFGTVQAQMSRDTRKVVSVVNGTAMLNNATLTTVTTTYDDGTSDVVFTNTDLTKNNFNTKAVSYGADGKVANILYNYPGGNFDNDVYNYMPDGTTVITNTNGQGDTFVYSAKTTVVDGYSVYSKHMIQESRPLYQDQVQVSDISNPSNPVAIAAATRNPDGSIVNTGSIDASKYLR
jgi:Flp pilus assembly pilin Flp